VFVASGGNASLSELMSVHFLCRNVFDGRLYPKLLILRTNFVGDEGARRLDLDRMRARSSLMRLLLKRTPSIVFGGPSFESSSLFSAVEALNEEMPLPSDFEVSDNIQVSELLFFLFFSFIFFSFISKEKFGCDCLTCACQQSVSRRS
jgi:hypothetical protein